MTPFSGNIALFVEGDSFRRQRCVLPHLLVGLVDQAVPLRVVTTDLTAESLALGPIQVVTREPARWPFSSRRLAALIEHLATAPPTIVHALSQDAYAVTYEVAEEFDAELVWTVGGPADAEALGRFDLGRIDAFVTPSAAMADRLRDRLPGAPERVHGVLPGVLAGSAPSAFRDDDRTPTIVCTCPFDASGSVETLIEAMHALRLRTLRPALFLLGEGRQEVSLRRLVRDRRLLPQVTFAHPVGELGPAFAHADLFVRARSPAVFEDDVLQAMAAGLVVVCSSTEFDDYLHDGATAVLVEPGSASAVADAIERVLSDRGAARAMADRALQLVRKEHSLKGMAEQAVGLYLQLALRRATYSVGGT